MPAPDSLVEPRSQPRPQVSTAALIIGNAVPLAGVIFLHWPVFPVMLLYWIENVFVGGFNVLRMAIAEPSNPLAWFMKLFMIPFFCFHFGLFTWIHGAFVLGMFGGADLPKGAHFPTWQLISPLTVKYNLGFAILALFMSRAISFGWNYIAGGEYKRAQVAQLMAAPYARVMVLHIAIILGGAAVAATGSKEAVVAVLVVAKTVVDVAMHRRERTVMQSDNPRFTITIAGGKKVDLGPRGPSGES